MRARSHRSGLRLGLGLALTCASGAGWGAEVAPLAPQGARVASTEVGAQRLTPAVDILTLDEVQASAKRAFPLLKASEIEEAMADADYLTAEGGFDLAWKSKGTATPAGYYYDSVRAESLLEQPTALWGASAFAGWRYGQGKIPVYDGKAQTLPGGEVRAGVNIPLWRNGPIDRRRATLERARLGRGLAGLTVLQQQIEVRRASAHRYWAWVAAGRRLEIAEDLLRIVLDRDAGLRERVQRGDLPPYESLDNARAIEQRRAQVTVAVRGLEQAGIELSLFLRDKEGNVSPPNRAALPRTMSVTERELGLLSSDVALAQQQRPDARRLRVQKEQQEVERRFAANQTALAVDVQVAGSQDLGASMPERPDLRDPVLELSVLVDVPLQTRSMQGRADAASASLARLGYQESYARERIEADVRDARSAIQRSSERIEATRREVALASELEEAERERFFQGDSHLFFVNLREQQTAEAKLRELEALLDLRRAVADLEAATGCS